MRPLSSSSIMEQMQETKFRFDGVYDEKTWEFLINKCHALGQPAHILFDFRPLSLNFLQQHRFLELMAKNFDPSARYYLQYQNEPEFVTQKMLDDLSEVLAGELAENFLLEFSDLKPASFYEQFNLPYFWHYQEGSELKNILSSPLLKGVVLPGEILEKYLVEDRLYSFVQTFLGMLDNMGSADLELILLLDWEVDFAYSLFEIFDFTSIAIPIDRHVQSGYRNVDIRKLDNNLKVLKDQRRLYNKIDRQA